MARALAGQADVNSTERRTPRGNPERGDRSEPEAREEEIRRLRQQVCLCDHEVTGELQGGFGQPPAQPGTAEIPPHGDRPQQGCGFVELEARATHDASLEAGHKGGGEVALEPVLREIGFVEQFEDLGQLLPARGADGNFRHGLLPPRSSSLMRVRISSRTVLNTSSRSSSPPAASEGSRNDQCRRCFAPGKVGQASLASSQTVTT